MAKIFHQPMRMCISCRKREQQSLLLRLSCVKGDLEPFRGDGRSFYLCENCINDEKRVLKSLMRQCKSGNKERLTNKLKEIIPDDRKS